MPGEFNAAEMAEADGGVGNEGLVCWTFRVRWDEVALCSAARIPVAPYAEKPALKSPTPAKMLIRVPTV